MSVPVQRETAEPPNWRRRVLAALNIGWVATLFLTLGGAIGTYLIWMSNSLHRSNIYIESNFEGELGRLKLQIDAQQGTIDAQRRRIDCLEKQMRTGKQYMVLGSTYECIEAPELKPATGIGTPIPGAPGSQP